MKSKQTSRIFSFIQPDVFLFLFLLTKKEIKRQEKAVVVKLVNTELSKSSDLASYRFKSDHRHSNIKGFPKIFVKKSVTKTFGTLNSYLSFKNIKNHKKFKIKIGERRGLNPRMVESQSTALPLGYARHKNQTFFINFFRMKKF